MMLTSSNLVVNLIILNRFETCGIVDMINNKIDYKYFKHFKCSSFDASKSKCVLSRPNVLW